MVCMNTNALVICTLMGVDGDAGFWVVWVIQGSTVPMRLVRPLQGTTCKWNVRLSFVW